MCVTCAAQTAGLTYGTHRNNKGGVMRLLTYYCGDHEARGLYPNLAGPGLHVVITYEPLPADPEAQKPILWDGRTVIAVHRRSGRTIACVLADQCTRLRWWAGSRRSFATRDWRLIGTLHAVSAERGVAKTITIPARAR